jgi:asparagine synthase (glutamine-hydrolysing)
MGFVHGEVSWSEPAPSVQAAIEDMLGVVTTDTWASARVVSPESQSGACCVLGAQSDRLAISGGASTGADSQLVSDVRLTDREELAGRLGLSAIESRHMSDADLIRHAYDRWGTACADRLAGEGAFALWDRCAGRLFCWRDVAGVRPFYYRYYGGRGLVFSSDLRSLIAHPRVPAALDLQYVRTLFDSAMAFRPPSRTLVEGALKLPAGHCLELTAAGLRVWRYWRPVDLPPLDYPDSRDYVEQLRALLEHAVSSRIPPDEDQVGAHLSGGLDSSSLAVLAARELRATQRLTGFSWAPPWSTVPEVEADERPLAEAAARFAAVPLRFTELRASHLVELHSGDRATLPIEAMRSELATSRDADGLGIRTMMSGWGGDELIVSNGIGYFADLARRARFLTIHRELRKRAALHGGSLRGAWKSRVIKPLLSDRSLRMLGWAPDGAADNPFPAELRPEFASCLSDVEPLEMVDYRERPGVHRNQLLRLTGGALQYRMEAWAAHGAALGITYTFPLLDRQVIEFALSIPDHLYFRDGWKRWLYRTAMEGVLPDRVRWNPDKYDNAAHEASLRVAPEARDLLRQKLRDRAANPYVDVQRLLEPSATERPDGDESRGSSPPAGTPNGGAQWLAFSELPLA